jgi:hypothetical protein
MLGIGSALIVFVFFLSLLFSPYWHDKYFGVAKNESSAVARLRDINSLEKRYTKSHPENGFTCELTLLRREATEPGELGHESKLSGEWRGYKFMLLACSADVNGTITHYQATAVPIRPYGTGVRAFCTDESGEILYDVEGSASQCFISRRLLN